MMNTSVLDLATQIKTLSPDKLIDVIKLAVDNGKLTPEVLSQLDPDVLKVVDGIKLETIHQFGLTFVTALKHHIFGMGWTLDQVRAMEAYACVLIGHPDGQIPDVNKTMGRLVRSKFADAIFTNHSGIPQDWFLGERQDWCRSMLLELKRKSAVHTTETHGKK